MNVSQHSECSNASFTGKGFRKKETFGDGLAWFSHVWHGEYGQGDFFFFFSEKIWIRKNLMKLGRDLE